MKIAEVPKKALRFFLDGFPGDDGEVQEVRRGQRW